MSEMSDWWYDDGENQFVMPKPKPAPSPAQPKYKKVTTMKQDPPGPTQSMTIADALRELDASVPGWKENPEIQSVVYPGLNALQALVCVADVVIESAKHNKHDTLVHPQVAKRVEQVCANKLLDGKGADPSIAAAYKLIFPSAAPGSEAVVVSTSKAPATRSVFGRKFS